MPRFLCVLFAMAMIVACSSDDDGGLTLTIIDGNNAVSLSGDVSGQVDPQKVMDEFALNAGATFDGTPSACTNGGTESKSGSTSASIHGDGTAVSGTVTTTYSGCVEPDLSSIDPGATKTKSGTVAVSWTSTGDTLEGTVTANITETYSDDGHTETLSNFVFTMSIDMVTRAFTMSIGGTLGDSNGTISVSTGTAMTGTEPNGPIGGQVFVNGGGLASVRLTFSDAGAGVSEYTVALDLLGSGTYSDISGPTPTL